MRFNREKRELKFHTCPRCGLKSLAINESCPECGLVFSRLEIATNKDAKKKIARHDKDFIVWTNKLPSDVSRIKLLLLTILCGAFGCHCFYVGRYWRGGILLANFIAIVMFVVFNEALIAIDGGKLLASLTTIAGIIALIWVYDVIMVVLKKFKVPIAIDLQSETHNENNSVEESEMQSEEIEFSTDTEKQDISITTQEENQNIEEKENEDSSRN